MTLTPKTLIDRRLAEGLKDIEEGRTYGPFNTAGKMVASLSRTSGKGRAKIVFTKRSRDARGGKI